MKSRMGILGTLVRKRQLERFFSLYYWMFIKKRKNYDVFFVFMTNYSESDDSKTLPSSNTKTRSDLQPRDGIVRVDSRRC